MAFRTQKISQMTPKGADLEATDLIEVSTIESGSYVTRSITGQELIDAIPLPPTGLTVGTTPISSGTIGRVLFQGTGNVLQQSSSLAYDDTLKTFTLIGPIGSVFQHTALTNYNGFGGFQLNVADGTERAFVKLQPNSGEFKIGTTSTGGYFTTIHSGGSEAMRIFASTRNIGINTTTDAGFRLDVNGTARVQTSLAVTTGKTFSPYTSNATNDALKLEVSNLSAVFGVQNSNAVGFSGIEYLSNAGVPRVFTGFNNGNGQEFRFNNVASGGYIDFLIGGTSGLRIANTRNILINTTTDAGFRLDVNGTARVDQTLQLNGTGTGTLIAMGGNVGRFTIDGLFIRFKASSGGDLLNMANNFFGVNQTSTIASAIMAITSTDRGFLPPRMTTTQKNAIASPATGLQVYDTTLNQMSYYNGTTWTNI